ncbi:hypothetical protein [Aminobacter sp. DSM 101952]|uniref:DUF7940 domain-containing protein n=1 Tax=Aminobacter sp. DSM 101952 TaxID=2735891 RepID=UPI001621931E|nr:hypothetical protein [Aminobacter sp. DSM 101952]
MTLVANWRAVLRQAWSVRLMLLAALLSGIEVMLPLVGGLLPIPGRGECAGGGAPDGRQAHHSWEGLVLRSHWDRYAKIWDICYGETKGIGPNMVKTEPGMPRDADAPCRRRLLPAADEMHHRIQPEASEPAGFPVLRRLQFWCGRGLSIDRGKACSSRQVSTGVRSADRVQPSRRPGGQRPGQAVKWAARSASARPSFACRG